MKNAHTIWSTKVEGKALQHKNEFIELLNLMQNKSIKTVLEIGTYKGGTAIGFLELGCTVTCIDEKRQPEIEDIQNTYGEDRLIFMEGDSKEVAKYFKVAVNDRWQMLYIDGGHNFEDAKADFENYSSFILKDGLIVFHDIRPFDGANHYGCAEYWASIKSKYNHIEILDSTIPMPNWGGFGVIFV